MASAPGATGVFPPPLERGRVGRIPVRNLWLLMLYASELFRHKHHGMVAVEENPDDIPDLVGELLARMVEVRLRRNLSYGYQHREAVLGRVRGRIDLLSTERRQLLARGVVACRYEELTTNTPRNRYVLAALDRIGRLARRADVSHRCRMLAIILKRMGVVGEKPTRSDMSTDRYGHHDAEDRWMVAAAHLAFDLALPTEADGNRPLALPDRDITWVRRLYERAVGGFYDVVLSAGGWQVDRGKSIRWQIDGKTGGVDAILPSMCTDVILEHRDAGRRIVIDTKFTSIVTEGWHREETLRSGHIYQMYAYLRSQENNKDPLSTHASGLLLYPALGAMVDETVAIQGHAIRFATVDLAASTSEMRRQLLQVVEPVAALPDHRPCP